MDAALLYRLASINQPPPKIDTGARSRTDSGIYPVSKNVDLNPSKASRTFEKIETIYDSYQPHPSAPKRENKDDYSVSQATEQSPTRRPTQPTGTRTQEPSRRPPTRPSLNPFSDSPGSYRDSRKDSGSSAVSTPDTESSRNRRNNSNLNLSLSVSPGEPSSELRNWDNLSQNEMQNFSPKGIKSGRRGWELGHDSSIPMQAPG